jgi:uncharacterized protein (DUF488 family)
MSPAGTIWTVGHSTLAAEDLAALLAPARIDLVADVRRFPVSRRHPQFNRDALAGTLARSGIGYLHLPGLGGRREPRADSRNTGWREAGFRGYADYMETDAFSAAMAALLAAAAGKRTALMCAEKDWRGCHRGLVSDYLKAHGFGVVHILDSGQTEPHPYTRPARIRNGKLSYAAEMPSQSVLDL